MSRTVLDVADDAARDDVEAVRALALAGLAAEGTQTRSAALAVLEALTAGLREMGDEAAAADLLLERVSNHEDAPTLRSMLAEVGTVALLRSARGAGWRPPRRETRR